MKPHPRQCIQAAGVGVAIAIAALGFYWGDQSARDRPRRVPYRVSGNSMAPTFVDQDVCRIRLSQKRLRIGDVVAIRWNDKHRLKRVAALGGDRVERSDGRLLINGQRLEDLIARRPPDGFVPPGWVAVSSDPSHWHRADSNHQWMIYTHHNPHQAGRVTPVMDDYPVNKSVRRKLNPVNRLAIEITPNDGPKDPLLDPVPTAIEIRVLFFDQPDPLLTTANHGLATLAGRDQDSEALPDGDAILAVIESLDASHPIAIELSPDQAVNFNLKVARAIEYRDDHPSGNVDYPITLRQDEVFVVGDNVPISVDSRTFGPLQLTDVLGRIEPTATPSR